MVKRQELKLPGTKITIKKYVFISFIVVALGQFVSLQAAALQFSEDQTSETQSPLEKFRRHLLNQASRLVLSLDNNQDLNNETVRGHAQEYTKRLLSPDGRQGILEMEIRRRFNDVSRKVDFANLSGDSKTKNENFEMMVKLMLLFDENGSKDLIPVCCDEISVRCDDRETIFEFVERCKKRKAIYPEKMFYQSLAEKHNSMRAMFELSLYSAFNKKDEGRDWCERLAKFDFQDKLLQFAEEYKKEKRNDLAIIVCKALVKRKNVCAAEMLIDLYGFYARKCNDINAASEMGTLCKNFGLENKGKEWCKKLTESVEVPGLLNLAYTFEDQDMIDFAFVFYKKLCEKGVTIVFPDGNEEVGLVFARKLAKDKKYEQAADLFKCAADKGDLDAMFELSCLYRDLGDNDQAYEYCQKAADNGHLDAKVKLRSLSQGPDDTTLRLMRMIEEALDLDY